MSHYWADLTTEQLAGMPRDQMIAVLPIAATEQHGPHLPLSVDVDIGRWPRTMSGCRLRGSRTLTRLSSASNSFRIQPLFHEGLAVI